MFVYNFKYIAEETDQFTLDFYNEHGVLLEVVNTEDDWKKQILQKVNGKWVNASYVWMNECLIFNPFESKYYAGVAR